MKIYTRTGDSGETGLFGGARVAKDAIRVEAYGSVDETNAQIGLARALGLPKVIDDVLHIVQSDLFRLGAELACAPGKENKLASDPINDSDILRLEQAIDSAETDLPALTNFILPCGTAGAAALHVARTVCRRAERRTLSAQRDAGVRNELLVYLNRLSDLLFVQARQANQLLGTSDTAWIPREKTP